MTSQGYTLQDGEAAGKSATYLCNLIKFAKELIEHMHQFPRGTVTGKTCESHNICIQDAMKQDAMLVFHYMEMHLGKIQNGYAIMCTRNTYFLEQHMKCRIF